jgi:hypothetical protein
LTIVVSPNRGDTCSHSLTGSLPIITGLLKPTSQDFEARRHDRPTEPVTATVMASVTVSTDLHHT